MRRGKGMYTHGNLAVRRDQEHKTTQRYIERTEIVTRKATLPAQEKLLYLFVIVLCVVISGSVIWKYAQIYEINTRMQQIEREIQLLEKENQSLKLEVNKLREPKRLMEIGKAMGFKPVEESGFSHVSSGEQSKSLNQQNNDPNKVAYRN